MNMTMKKGVLLLQMGGPCCISGIEGFLFNLFNDRFIIQLPKFLKPFQKYLAKFIAWRRAPKVAVNYEEIGGRSPILFETQCQARALEKELNKNTDDEYQCFIAMRYTYPFLKDTIKDIEASGIESLDVVPLYPQYSIATTGSSFWECKTLFRESGLKDKIKIDYVVSWETNEYFIELLKNRILDKLELFPKNEKTYLLFSAHGLPVKYIEKGDPYQKQIEASFKAIIDSLPVESIQNIEPMITYQSRVGPVQWLEPNTEDVLEMLGKDGVKNILIVPISFVGDHIETLHELGIEYREVAEEFGIENYHVTRLPKANPLLIKALASSINKDIYKKELAV
jgi:ferrochelatase